MVSRSFCQYMPFFFLWEVKIAQGYHNEEISSIFGDRIETKELLGGPGALKLGRGVYLSIVKK